MITCSIEGCSRLRHARGLCPTHYERLRRTGTTADPDRDEAKRFWRYVEKSTGGCWLWSGSKDKKGYGQFYLRGRPIKAHRASWLLATGADVLSLVGTCVLHRCDNPRCVRPDHLFLGTRADNNADMLAKGRAHPLENPAGVRHPRARLTSADLRRIAELHHAGMTAPTISRMMGVRKHNVSRVLQGRSYIADFHALAARDAESDYPALRGQFIKRSRTAA